MILADIAWGTVGEWFGGGAAAAAVAYAVFATRSERKRSDRNLAEERELTQRALALESERWAVDLFERTAWQARMISCERRNERDGREPCIRFVVPNHSSMPVFGLQAFVVFQGVAHRPRLNLSTAFVMPVGEERRPSVEVPSLAAFDVPDRHCGVTFRDSSGFGWARYADGHLVRLVHQEPSELVAGAMSERPQG
jgi:hypothetical protein